MWCFACYFVCPIAPSAQRLSVLHAFLLASLRFGWVIHRHVRHVCLHAVLIPPGVPVTKNSGMHVLQHAVCKNFLFETKIHMPHGLLPFFPIPIVFPRRVRSGLILSGSIALLYPRSGDRRLVTFSCGCHGLIGDTD